MTLDEKSLERAVVAMFAATEGVTHGNFDILHPDVRKMMTAMCRTAITAFQAEAWQPWETVPRDGDDVLARNGDFRQIVFWDEQENTGWHVADAEIRYPEGAFTHWRRDCLATPNPPASP